MNVCQFLVDAFASSWDNNDWERHPPLLILILAILKLCKMSKFSIWQTKPNTITSIGKFEKSHKHPTFWDEIMIADGITEKAAAAVMRKSSKTEHSSYASVFINHKELEGFSKEFKWQEQENLSKVYYYFIVMKVQDCRISDRMDYQSKCGDNVINRQLIYLT